MWTTTLALALGLSVARPAHVTVSATRASLRPPQPTMLFGGGGGGPDAPKAPNMMETIQKAQQMGKKVKELQDELANTEVEASAADGGVVVIVTATQEPLSVTVTDDLAAQGSKAVSEAVSLAFREAHANSMEYSKNKLAALYEEIGLPVPPGPRRLAHAHTGETAPLLRRHF